MRLIATVGEYVGIYGHVYHTQLPDHDGEAVILVDVLDLQDYLQARVENPEAEVPKVLQPQDCLTVKTKSGELVIMKGKHAAFAKAEAKKEKRKFFKIFSLQSTLEHLAREEERAKKIAEEATQYWNEQIDLADPRVRVLVSQDELAEMSFAAVAMLQARRAMPEGHARGFAERMEALERFCSGQIPKDLPPGQHKNRVRKLMTSYRNKGNDLPSLECLVFEIQYADSPKAKAKFLENSAAMDQARQKGQQPPRLPYVPTQRRYAVVLKSDRDIVVERLKALIEDKESRLACYTIFGVANAILEARFHVGRKKRAAEAERERQAFLESDRGKAKMGKLADILSAKSLSSMQAVVQDSPPNPAKAKGKKRRQKAEEHRASAD